MIGAFLHNLGNVALTIVVIVAAVVGLYYAMLGSFILLFKWGVWGLVTVAAIGVVIIAGLMTRTR